MKHLKPILFAFLIIFVLVFLIVFLPRFIKDAKYKKAVSFLKNDDLSSAQEKVEKINYPDFNEETFAIDMNEDGKIKNAYKDSIEIYSYILALKRYRQEDKNLENVIVYLDFIDDGYTGEFYKDIKKFKDKAKKEYDKYLKVRDEELKLCEEERKKEEEKYLENLSKTVPYEGMNTYYIAKTAMGEYDHIEFIDSSEKGINKHITKYSWENNDGDIVLIVQAKDNKVYEVIKYYQDWFWDKNGMPNFSAVNPYKYKKNKSLKEKSDPYKASDYDDFYDFYEDKGEEFSDIDEAETYYIENYD